MNKSTSIETTNQVIDCIRSKKIAHLNTEDQKLESNVITVEGKELVNFGSCSYLGLEFDSRLKAGATQALQNYGTQFSASRAYLSVTPYQHLEQRLEKIFDNPVIVSPTTTLGHIAAIPVLVDKNDVVIMDHQVHNSVQTAVKLVKSDGVHVELVRHNRLDLLERRICELADQYERIWYMADGVYSMYGDFLPVREVRNLLEKYEKLNVYVDDAHGMSCYGKHGRGHVLSEYPQHERMVVATSFAKAFATGGGAIVFPNREMAQRVRNCGGPMITSGPMQPSALGAAIAAADIHLSDEIYKYQEELAENIRYTDLMLEKSNLPNLSEARSPIFFVGVGLPKVGYNLVTRMFENGYLVNIGIFPAVPMKNTGVRFTITRLHTFEQIEEMVNCLAIQFDKALAEENYSREQINRAFKIKSKSELQIEREIQDIIIPKNLTVTIHNSIMDVDKSEWNNCLGNIGMLDWNGMNVLEHSFTENTDAAENWDFNYIIVRDHQGKVLLSTFSTAGIIKDDMLTDKEISKDIELCRITDSTFYTSKFLSLGSLVTEGEHLYLDKSSPEWKQALDLLFRAMDDLQKLYEATTLIIRDLSTADPELDDIMVDNGYFKMEMPLSYQLDLSSWASDTDFIDTLSKRSRKHFKQNVRRFFDLYTVDTSGEIDRSEMKELYGLYLNVHDKSLDINTHKIPLKLFENMILNKQWDIIRLKLKANDQTGLAEEKTVGVVFSYKGQAGYVGGMVGIDYEFNRSFGVYRQLIYRFIERGRELNYKAFDFGFCAGIEKKKFGASEHRSCAYMQVKDNFVFEALITDSRRKELVHG